MAVFIKRDRLGSGRPPRSTTSSPLTHAIENSPGFKALRNSYAQAKEQQAAALKDKYESNSEVQEWRNKTKEQQTREAIDHVLPTCKEVVSMRQGKEASYEDTRKYAESLAYKSERQKAGE